MHKDGTSHFTTPFARSGTPPPCLSNSSSLARASRISAWRSESLTSFFSSSKETTRYSILSRVNSIVLDGPALLTIPHRPITRHRAPCPLSGSRWPAVAFGSVSDCELSRALCEQTYLDAPLSHVCSDLFGLWPFEWRSHGTRLAINICSCDDSMARGVSYSSPIVFSVVCERVGRRPLPKLQGYAVSPPTLQVRARGKIVVRKGHLGRVAAGFAALCRARHALSFFAPPLSPRAVGHSPGSWSWSLAAASGEQLLSILAWVLHTRELLMARKYVAGAMATINQQSMMSCCAHPIVPAVLRGHLSEKLSTGKSSFQQATVYTPCPTTGNLSIRFHESPGRLLVSLLPMISIKTPSSNAVALRCAAHLPRSNHNVSYRHLAHGAPRHGW